MGASGCTTYYYDGDGDGYGLSTSSQCTCSGSGSYDTTDNSDCDDGRSGINPGETETCDGQDDDCDGEIDDGVTTTYYADADGDGYGDPDTSTDDCSAPSGYVTDDSDCDDGDGDTFPGAASAESTTACMTDADSDGYGADSTGAGVTAGTDCDDGDGAVSPGATEVEANGVDDDCDGVDTIVVDDFESGIGSAWTVVLTGPEASTTPTYGGSDGSLGFSDNEGQLCISLDYEYSQVDVGAMMYYPGATGSSYHDGSLFLRTSDSSNTPMAVAYTSGSCNGLAAWYTTCAGATIASLPTTDGWLHTTLSYAPGDYSAEVCFDSSCTTITTPSDSPATTLCLSYGSNMAGWIYFDNIAAYGEM